ncbi:unnamed protein product, partial [Thlaspi arvense]
DSGEVRRRYGEIENGNGRRSNNARKSLRPSSRFQSTEVQDDAAATAILSPEPLSELDRRQSSSEAES